MSSTTLAAEGAQDLPAGLGIAVVFDWALAVQLLTQAIAGVGGHLGQSSSPRNVIGRLVAAAVAASLGEALRRGIPAARIVQIGLTTLLSLSGLLGLLNLATGHAVPRGRALSLIVLCTFAPFVVWRLSLPRTGRWFQRTRGHGGAPRLSGAPWVTGLLAWSAVWGVAVAWSQSLH